MAAWSGTYQATRSRQPWVAGTFPRTCIYMQLPTLDTYVEFNRVSASQSSSITPENTVLALVKASTQSSTGSSSIAPATPMSDGSEASDITTINRDPTNAPTVTTYAWEEVFSSIRGLLLLPPPEERLVAGESDYVCLIAPDSIPSGNWTHQLRWLEAKTS